MPVINDPNDVIIRIEYVGVCGSDVSLNSWAVHIFVHLHHLSNKRRSTSGRMVVLGTRLLMVVHW